MNSRRGTHGCRYVRADGHLVAAMSIVDTPWSMVRQVLVLGRCDRRVGARLLESPSDLLDEFVS